MKPAQRTPDRHRDARAGRSFSLTERRILRLLAAIALVAAGLVAGASVAHTATTTSVRANYNYDRPARFAQHAFWISHGPAGPAGLPDVRANGDLAAHRSVGRIGVAAEEADSGALIFRGGTQTDNALTDKGSGLSFRDSLSNPANREDAVLRPGEKYFAVDPSKLRPGSVVRDNVPPGHVPVKGLSPIVDPQGDPFLGGKFPR
jgi:hypothetical protein